jgi:carboxymethylenebutenolidase
MPVSTIDIPAPDGVADAVLVKPDAGRHPGVLFLIDAFGLRPTINEMAERISSHGYTVLAPNVFYRSGRAPVVSLPDLTDPEARSGLFEKLRPLLGELTPERVRADGAAYLDFLSEHAEPGPVAITGYCLGTRLGIIIAASQPQRVAALAGFHGGRLVSDEPDSPHRLVDRLQAEVYLGFADRDPSMPAEQIEELQQALRAAGVRFRAEVYAGAAHGYTMADTAAYNAEAAERHYENLLALLQRSLGAMAAPAS